MRVVVFGYIGFGNLGDEAVLAGTIRAVRTVSPGAEVVAVSSDPPATERVHGIRAVARRDLFGLRATLRGADGFLLGGGSLLQDRTSMRSLALYLTVFDRACRYVPGAWWAMGLGPLQRGLSRRWVAASSRRARTVVLRDAPSARLLEALGGAQPVLGSDAAFALSAQARPEPSRALAVAPRAFSGQNVEGFSRTLRAVAEKHDLDIVFLPLQPQLDGPLCAELARRAGPRAKVCDLPEQPLEAIAFLGQFPLLLATRLHAMLLAAVAGVPSVYIPYDPKVEAFGQVLGLEGPAGPGGLEGALVRGLSQSEDLGRAMHGRLQQERERLVQAMETVLASL